MGVFLSLVKAFYLTDFVSSSFDRRNIVFIFIYRCNNLIYTKYGQFWSFGWKTEKIPNILGVLAAKSWPGKNVCTLFIKYSTYYL